MAVNTLELLGVYVLFAFTYGVDAVRKWSRAPRPRDVLTLSIGYAAAMLVVSGTVFLYLLTHPADIQPVQAVARPGWIGWGLYAPVILFILGLLIRVSEALLSRARRLRQRS